ncbi:hypothetical protein BED46_006295 [Burkholderia contaminans]|uniref:Uncharacterized protein n=1 Tax=Burkholderia contaminans LMG 23361 TaxID=1334628 RepID=A0ABD4AW13_9BURK|nr:hypothetical protein WR31_14725 [Burkholderia contaminans LMG 23361]ODN27185.1 hypothetical protein BGI28_01435 [Burkholderia contaminans]OMI82506.1 hypothetical protein BED46_006295 [Burkholderia contaminans]
MAGHAHDAAPVGRNERRRCDCAGVRVTRTRAANARRESAKRDVADANRPRRTVTMRSGCACRVRPRFARCAQA